MRTDSRQQQVLLHWIVALRERHIEFSKSLLKESGLLRFVSGAAVFRVTLGHDEIQFDIVNVAAHLDPDEDLHQAPFVKREKEVTRSPGIAQCTRSLSVLSSAAVAGDAAHTKIAASTARHSTHRVAGGKWDP